MASSREEDSLKTACLGIEKNNPAIKQLEIDYLISWSDLSHMYPQWAGISWDCHPNGNVSVHHRTCSVTPREFWSRISQVISNSSTIREIGIKYTNSSNHRTIEPETLQSLHMVYEGLEQNTLINTLGLFLIRITPDGDTAPLPTLNLQRFVQNNQNFTCLKLSSFGMLSVEQGKMIKAVLEGESSLKELTLVDYHKYRYVRCDFDSNETLGQIITSCWKLKSLVVQCENMSTYTAVADLLRNPAAKLVELRLVLRGDAVQGLSAILAGLCMNKKLSSLHLGDNNVTDDLDQQLIGTLVCDTSSIKSICNSNDSFKYVDREQELSSFVKECLQLNQNRNKTQVIRQKISTYFFVGNFDDIPVPLLPRVMNLWWRCW
jgi:hypothetical protein